MDLYFINFSFVYCNITPICLHELCKNRSLGVDKTFKLTNKYNINTYYDIASKGHKGFKAETLLNLYNNVKITSSIALW